MSVKAGYIREYGAGAGGGAEVLTPPLLREIGLTPDNNKFVVTGRAGSVLSWIRSHQLLKVTRADGKSVQVQVCTASSTDAGAMMREGWAGELLGLTAISEIASALAGARTVAGLIPESQKIVVAFRWNNAARSGANVYKSGTQLTEILRDLEPVLTTSGIARGAATAARGSARAAATSARRSAGSASRFARSMMSTYRQARRMFG